MHQLYQAALSNLIDAQKPGALKDVRLQLGNQEKIVNLKIPIMYIIGDIHGGDGICGQKMNYQKSTLRISRTCDAGTHILSSPKAFSCKGLMMNDVITLVNNKNLEQLQELYQAPHWIPWFDLNYGGNPEGIFTAACPQKLYMHWKTEFTNMSSRSFTSIYSNLHLQYYWINMLNHGMNTHINVICNLLISMDIPD